MKNHLHIYKRVTHAIIGLILCLVTTDTIGQYAIHSADDLYFCETVYPTGYQTMSQFYIYETNKKKFNQNQNDVSLIFTLPAGFEFNPGIGTVSLSNTGDWDAGGSPFAWVVGTNTITVSGIYTDGQGTFDTIYFDGLQVNAMSSGNSGDLVRTGGTMNIDGSTNNPGATESFGYMFADLPMTYASSQVTQPNTNNIRKSCGIDADILEIKISVTGNCPAEITQLDFNTLGDPGYTQNPLTNLTDASVYYAGTTSGFTTTELFGNVASPNGAFTITGSKLLLSAGDHYFYLTYDIPLSANAGDNVDASMTSFILDGTTYSNMATPNPGGFRPITNDLCLQPDLPNPNANMTFIPQGSLVIPMDNTNQSLTGGLFNLKAYGLIHALVNEDVPVMWVIRSGKNKDDIDYSANSTRIYPDTVASSNIDYTSGMFVIDSSWINTPFSQWVLSAWQIIQPWGNQVAVYKLDQDVMWDVRYNLSQRTKLAVFNNGGNDPIHVNILNSAGCTNYFTVGAGVFAGIDACYTFCSEPHWAGTLADSAITENVRSFIYRGGNFLAQCRGVETYENYSLENMHSTAGIDILNTTVSHSYNNVDMAFMQFEGILTENEGGSERNWILSEATGSGWRPNKFWYGVSDSDIDTIVASGAHMRHPDSVGGNVFYMGGHDYAPYSDVESINAARMYMNATLIPSGRPTLFNLDPGDSLLTCTNYPIQLGGSPTGPNDATYSWSGPNLDDPTAQNPIATPSDTSVYTVLAYRGGCIVGPYSVTVTVREVPVVDAGTNVNLCSDQTSLALTGTVTNSTGGEWTSSGTGSFANPNSLNTSYTFSVADVSFGSIDLYLTSKGGCDSIADTLSITFSPVPIVNAGIDISTCKDVSTVGLNGSVSNATGGTWSSSGTGTFNPSVNSLTGNYIPSSADTAAGSVTLTLTTTGSGVCNALTDNVIITFTDIPSANAGIDQIVCGDVTGITLNGITTVASGGSWITNGTGTFSPNNTSLGAVYIPSNTDTASGNITLTLTTTGNGLCQAYNDQMNITIIPSPLVSSGTDQTVCGDIAAVPLNGSVSNAGGGNWTTSGTGNFSPNNTTLNGNYIPSSGDTLTGAVTLTLTTTGNGTCNTYTNDITVTFTNAPTVSAGSDITTCKDVTSISLSGSVSAATGGIWTSSGTGSFSPSANSLTGSYIPSAADTAVGGVTLTLTTTGNGLCNSYTDNVIIILTDIPTVNAGTDQSICADATGASLAGSVTIASGGTWVTSGTGTFSPDNNTLGAIYIPSNADTTAGTVTLTLTTTGNGLCQAYTDQVTITITAAPFANAGSDQTVCGDIAAVPLTGVVTNGTGGSWATSGTGSFSPNNTTLNANYIPSVADTLNGSVTLTLTTTGNGACNSYADNMIITFTNAPTVSAGSDITTCKDVVSINLTGSVITANGGTWSTSGTGIFNPNNSTLTASYIPSAADTAAGGVTLTLTTTGNGLCNSYTDNVIITLTDLPVAYASSDQTVCADITGVSLNGGVIISSGGLWTTNGTGVFTPSDSDLNATYVPSAGDTTVGNVILTLTTTGNGLCQAYNDQMTITITPAPIAFAGNDTSVCSTNPVVPLGGSVTTATGGIWSTNGSGTFTPNNTDLNAIYQTSLSDQTNGSLEIYLTTTGNGLCNAVTDTMFLTITPTSITVFVGNDTLVCGDDSLALNGVITTATGGIWSTLGDGTFSDTTDLNASYYFGPNDTVANTVDLYLTTTGNGGCLAQIDSFQVDIQDPLELIVMSADTACGNGGAINISSIGNTGQGYWITNGDGTFLPDSTILNSQYLPGVTDIASNSITLTFITENNGVCSAINDSLVIELIDAPSVNFGFANICLNETVFFTDSSSAIGGITSWNWDFNDTFLSSMQDTNVTFTSYGTQTATLVVTSGYGCIDSLTQDVIVSPLPIAGMTSNADCYEDSVELFDASTVPTGSIMGWEWSVENGFTGTTQDVSVIFDSASVYSATLIVTTDMGCSDTITDTLQVQPNPIASFISDSVCLNNLSNMADGSIVEFGTIVTWEWMIDGVSTDTLPSTTYTFGSDSLQPVTLIVTSSYGCIDTVTQDVVVHPLPNNGFSYEGFCEEDDVLFTDETTINSGQVVAWDWDFGNTVTSSDQNPSNGFGVTGTFNVTLITTSDYGCLDTITQNISISPNPSAEFSMSTDVIQVLDPVYFTDLSVDASQWEWDFGDTIGTSTDQNPDYAWNTYNQYTVFLTITNDFGCTDTVSHVITVKQPPLLPLAFSPNGDGLNDVFYVLGGTFIEFRFEIYNNWGKMIFESNDPLVGWDGTHLDIAQPLGVYVWIYHVVTEDGIEYSAHGDVTIIR